jgi:cytoskeletal protein CcmA (bactofilin family)
MFSKNKSSNSYEVVIGEHTEFNGNINAEGNVRIDGQLVGDVKSNGEVFIGSNSTITGDITSSQLTISGVVQGEVKVIGELKITETGNLVGDILVSSFIINKGGTFKGNCSINTADAQSDLESLAKEFNIPPKEEATNYEEE